MATFTSSSYDGRYMDLVITETVDSVNNSSTLSWILSSKGGSVNYYSTGATTVTINGTRVYYKARTEWDSRVFPAAKGSVSGTITVPHGSDGKKTVTVVFKTTIYNGEWDIKDYGGSMTLTNIDRSSPTVSFSVSNITTSGFKISASSSATADRWYYSLNGGSTYTQFSTTSGTSASYTLSGLTSKTYSVKVKARKSVNHLEGSSSAVSVDCVAPTVSFSVSAITSSGFTISASSSATADRWYYSLNGGSTYTQFSTTSGTSAAKAITDLTPNVAYNVKVKARKSSNQVEGYSSTTTVTTLGGAILNSVNAFTIDDNNPSIVMNWTVYSTTFYHKLVIKNGNTTILTIKGLTGSVGTTNKSIALSSSQRTTILNAMESLASFNATFTITTHTDSACTSSTIGGASSTNAVISTTAQNSSPSFSNPAGFTFKDNNNSTVAITSNNSILIKDYSQLLATVYAATPKNGAYIATYSVQVGDKIVQKSTSGNINFGAVPTYGTLSIIVTATDSRGYTCSVTKECTCINYADIVITDYAVRRVNEVETTVQLTIIGEISPIYINSIRKNAIQSARFKVGYGGTWNNLDVVENSQSFSFHTDALSDNNGHIIEFDSNSIHDLYVEISDKLSTDPLTVRINKGTPLVAYRSQKVGINKVDPQSALDVNGDIRMNGYNVQGFIAEIDNTVDLNTILTPGIYSTPINSNNGLHYPVNNSVGVLEVLQVSNIFILQRFTTVSGQVYCRGKYNTTWHNWA